MGYDGRVEGHVGLTLGFGSRADAGVKFGRGVDALQKKENLEARSSPSVLGTPGAVPDVPFGLC